MYSVYRKICTQVHICSDVKLPKYIDIRYINTYSARVMSLI